MTSQEGLALLVILLKSSSDISRQKEIKLGTYVQLNEIYQKNTRHFVAKATLSAPAPLKDF